MGGNLRAGVPSKPNQVIPHSLHLPHGDKEEGKHLQGNKKLAICFLHNLSEHFCSHVKRE